MYKYGDDPVEIDGSLGEGGGQILRIALSLSAICGINVVIKNIRSGRANSGLSQQHVKGIELVQSMCNGSTNGAFIGSTKLMFTPQKLVHQGVRKFTANSETAACICLMAQVALPVAVFFPHDNPVTLVLKGGTNVPMGPHIEYFTEVFKPLLNMFGPDFDFTVLSRGYYPKGGGQVDFYVNPLYPLKPINLITAGVPREIVGWAYVAGNLPVTEAIKMATDAKKVLTNGLAEHNISLPAINIEAYKEDKTVANYNGSGINIVCTTTRECIFGGSGLGSTRFNKRGEPPPGVVAATEILDAILAGSCVDEHAQDQLIIFMALAEGVSRMKIGSRKLTRHAETAIEIVKVMLKDRNVHFNLCNSEDDGSCILECKGCGFVTSAV